MCFLSIFQEMKHRFFMLLDRNNRMDIVLDMSLCQFTNFDIACNFLSLWQYSLYILYARSLS